MAPPEVPPGSAMDALHPDKGNRDHDMEKNQTLVSAAGAELLPLPPSPLAEEVEPRVSGNGGMGFGAEEGETGALDVLAGNQGLQDDEDLAHHVFGNGGTGFGAEEGEPGALAIHVGDQDPQNGEELAQNVFGNGVMGFGAEEGDPAPLAVHAVGQDPQDDEDLALHVFGNDGVGLDAEEAVPAGASTDDDDEGEPGVNGGLGLDEDDAADFPTNVDLQEGDGADDVEAGTLALGTEPVIRAMAVGGVLAVVLGLGGALMLGIATTTGPRHQDYEYNVDDARQPPLLCAGDNVSSACHPWGATSTASPRPPLLVAVPTRLPMPRTAIRGTDEHPRVVSGAADWAQQHHRGATSSSVPLPPARAGGSEERLGAAALLVCLFFVAAMIIAAFQTIFY